MAGQVTNWIYSDQGDVRWFNTNMDYQIAVDTLPEAYKYFSSTYYVKGHAAILDNRYEEAGLIIRPLTSDSGKTGVMTFNITHPDAKYRSSSVCCYGQTTIQLLIEQIFVASGLQFDNDEYYNAYKAAVLRRVIGDPGLQQLLRANVCIENSSGGYKTLGYVDKQIVDAILNAMAQEGMFTMVYEDLPEVIEAGTVLEVEPLMTLEETVDIALSDCMDAPSMAAWKQSSSGQDYADWTISLEEMMGFIEDGFTANDIDIDDYDYCQVEISAANPGGWHGRPNCVTVRVVLNNFIDDQVCLNNDNDVSLTEYDPDIDQGKVGWLYNGNANTFRNYIPMISGGSNIDRPSISFNVVWDTTNHFNYVYNDAYSFSRSSTARPVIVNVGQSYYKPGAAFDPEQWISDGWCTNYGFDGAYPEGISKQEGATVPKNVTALATDFWPGWDTNSYMDHLLGYMTYVAVGFGDRDNPAWTQARVQTGEIHSDYYQELLGVNIENLDEFTTIAEAYYGEDVDPIIPTDEPTPNPTPTDEEPSLTNSALFRVHKLTNQEVDNLGNFLFSNTFVSAIQNMFQDSLSAIIGLFVLAHGTSFPTGASEELKLGSIACGSGVTGTALTDQFTNLGCGSVNINEYYENVEDYDYTDAEIFLPYVGFRSLDIREIMGGRVEVSYKIDCFTGACLARIYVTKDGAKQELYNFSGNCAVTLPLTSRDFTQGVTSLLSGALGIAGGAATGNAMAMAYGASNMIGDLSKISRSGSLSANIGFMGGQKPFIVIKRPVPYNALNYPQYYGKPSNWTVTLSSCSGYTRVKDVHLDNLNCTDQEREEILALLKEGVIF